jgi:hypothetical protein
MTQKNNLYERRNEKAIQALLRHTTLSAAAKSMSLNEKTLRRWWVLPDFQEKYRSAKRELIAGSSHVLLAAMGTSVRVLITIMEDAAQPASARVSAARCILQAVQQGMQQEDLAASLLALQSRLDALERQDVVESNHNGAF